MGSGAAVTDGACDGGVEGVVLAHEDGLTWFDFASSLTDEDGACEDFVAIMALYA